MTILNDNEIEKIAKHEFALEFLRARLVQQTTQNPKVYTGSGSIAQSKDGSLELKMYCPIDIVDGLFEGLGAGNIDPGQLIGEENYYSFEGVDFFGQSWVSKNIWVNADVSFPASGKIVRSKLRYIENRRKLPADTTVKSTVLFIPGIYKIPFNVHQPETIETNLSACTIDFGDDRTCQLKSRGNLLVVNIQIKGDGLESYAERVVEGVGVAIGAHLVALAEIRVADGERIQTVRSLDKRASENHRILPPIPVQGPHHFFDFQNFVRAYVEKIEEPFSQTTGYWYRVLVVFESGLENQALVLSTAIEGLLKASFQNEGKPECEFLEQIADAIPKIKALTTLALRARERILSSLGGAKNSTPSNALHALSGAGKVPASFIEVWKKLRNKTAHADELKLGEGDMQKFIDELHACLELFYRLIMLTIDYRGAIVEYSKYGWPDGALSLPVDVESLSRL